MCTDQNETGLIDSEASVQHRRRAACWVCSAGTKRLCTLKRRLEGRMHQIETLASVSLAAHREADLCTAKLRPPLMSPPVAERIRSAVSTSHLSEVRESWLEIDGTSVSPRSGGGGANTNLCTSHKHTYCSSLGNFLALMMLQQSRALAGA